MRIEPDYSKFRIDLEIPEKCRENIGNSICHSRKFLKINSFVKIRGTICTHYKCNKCGASYFVVATSPAFSPI